MIRVTIEIEHGDGSIEIKRDNEYMTGQPPTSTLSTLVAAAHASALAALTARSN